MLDIVIVYEKIDEWSIEWQRMTTSDNKCQWVTENDSGTTNENDTVHLKECVTNLFLWQKTDTILSDMDGCNYTVY